MVEVDVYDTLISTRHCKQDCAHQEALDIMRAGRSSHFNPDVLDIRLPVEAQFRSITMRFGDEGDPAAVGGI